MNAFKGTNFPQKIEYSIIDARAIYDFSFSVLVNGKLKCILQFSILFGVEPDAKESLI